MKYGITKFASPVGMLTLASDGQVLFTLSFGEDDAGVHDSMRVRFGACEIFDADARRIEDDLAAYFAGDLLALDRIEVLTGGTAFQRDVWSALRTISAGTTTSYSSLAARIGRPSATRAVGLANGSNPVAIVVPCHRVIGANNTLTGYGGGLDRKRWLLEHERVPLMQQSFYSHLPSSVL